MTAPTPDEFMACGRCGRMLERTALVAFGPTVGWQHPVDLRAAGEDHMPEPVPAASITPALKCDFCFADGVSWELPAGNFETVPPGTSDLAPGGLMSVGSWLACDTCADLIAGDRWNSLAQRAHAAYVSRHGAGAINIGLLMRTYANLRAAALGPIRPLPGDPGGGDTPRGVGHLS